MLSDSASLQRASNKTAYAVQLVGSPVNVARFGAKVHPIKKPRAKTSQEYGNLRSGELGGECSTHLRPEKHGESAESANEHHGEYATPS